MEDILASFGGSSKLYIDLDSADPELRHELGFVVGLSWRPSDVEYLLGAGPLPGYETVKEYSYQSWLPPHRRRILVLRKSQQPALPMSDTWELGHLPPNSYPRPPPAPDARLVLHPPGHSPFGGRA
jgi:hypothetical protein